MAFQLLFGALFGGNAQWVGDVGGFVAGGAVAVLLSPAAWARCGRGSGPARRLPPQRPPRSALVTAPSAKAAPK
jgi:hypothetical protein